MADIKPELIEKARLLTDWSQHEYRVIPDDWIPYCICGWRAEEPYDVPAYDRHITETVLATVADDLRAEGAAQALRGAAETLDGAMPRHLGVSDLDYLDYDTDVEYGIDCAAEFLRARADRIEARDE